jgi:hypothetical protein
MGLVPTLGNTEVSQSQFSPVSDERKKSDQMICYVETHFNDYK